MLITEPKRMEEIIKKADVLIEALPYIQKFNKKIVVIKCGGAVMEDDQMRIGTLKDIAFMSYVGMKPVLIHGGGTFISKNMQKLGKKPKFIDGHRVTDKDTMQIVNKTLSRLNKKIVQEIRRLKAEAIGLSGKDKNLFRLKKQKFTEKRKFGYVGQIKSVNTKAIKEILKQNKIPVIYSVAADKQNEIFNINADQAGCEIAVSLNAEKLVLLTNIKGIMRNEDDGDSLISTLTVKEAKDLIKRQVITGGMLPKVKACIKALTSNIKKTHIIDGRTPHSLLLEIFTDKGVGTEIIRNSIGKE